MSHFAHPVNEKDAAVFHGVFVVLYALALGFHGLCAWRHYQDHRREQC